MAERVCKGMIDIVITWVGDHVFFCVEARVRQQRGKRVYGGMGEFWNTVGDQA